MTASRITLQRVVSSRAGVEGLLKAPGDCVLIERGVPRWLIMRCPCGCGEDIPVNLDQRAGKAWRLYRKGGVSLFPSVWRDTGCQSHFIVWRDQIWLSGAADRYFADSQEALNLLAQRVVAAWPSGRPRMSYIELADGLQEIPWDVLDACRVLARRGLLREGQFDERGLFEQLPAWRSHNQSASTPPAPTKN